MISPETYLNPVELLGLTDASDISFEMLQKEQKRFLSKLELNGNKAFDYFGQLYTVNDLERVIKEASYTGILASYTAAARVPGLSAFLSNGTTTDELCDKPLTDTHLSPVLQKYFPSAFDSSFLEAIQSADLFAIRRLNRWEFQFKGLEEGQLYDFTYLHLSDKVDQVISDVALLEKDNSSNQVRAQKYRQIFKNHLPRKVLVLLPAYFKELINRLVTGIRKTIKVLNDEKKDYLAADLLIKLMLRLPHLTPTNLFDLQTQSSIIDNNLDVSGQKLSPERKMVFSFRLAIALIPLIMLFWLYLQIPGKNKKITTDTPKVTSIHNSRFWPSDTRPAEPLSLEEGLQISIAEKIRSNINRGASLNIISIPEEAKVPLPIQQLFQQEDQGVILANQILQLLYFDTIPHQKGVLSKRIITNESPTIERIYNFKKDGLLNSEVALKELIRIVREEEEKQLQ